MKHSAILDHLKASAHMAHHPMLLPVILFRKLVDSSIEHRGKLHRDVFAVEKELGYLDPWNHPKERYRLEAAPFTYPVYHDNETTRFRNQDTEKGSQNALHDGDGSKQTPGYFQNISRRLHTCKKQAATRYSRHWFWKQFRECLFEAFDAIEQIVPGNKFQQLADARSELKYWDNHSNVLFIIRIT
jgi:hypothetical protein